MLLIQPCALFIPKKTETVLGLGLKQAQHFEPKEQSVLWKGRRQVQQILTEHLPGAGYRGTGFMTPPAGAWEAQLKDASKLGSSHQRALEVVGGFTSHGNLEEMRKEHRGEVAKHRLWQNWKGEVRVASDRLVLSLESLKKQQLTNLVIAGFGSRHAHAVNH